MHESKTNGPSVDRVAPAHTCVCNEDRMVLASNTKAGATIICVPKRKLGLRFLFDAQD